MFRSYSDIRELGHGKCVLCEGSPESHLLRCSMRHSVRAALGIPGQQVQLLNSLFTGSIQCFRVAVCSSSSSCMGDGGRGLGRWRSHLALITIKTPPSVSMVTASPPHWQHIPGGTRWFLFNRDWFFRLSVHGSRLVFVCSQEVCGC